MNGVAATIALSTERVTPILPGPLPKGDLGRLPNGVNDGCCFIQINARSSISFSIRHADVTPITPLSNRRPGIVESV